MGGETGSGGGRGPGGSAAEAGRPNFFLIYFPGQIGERAGARAGVRGSVESQNLFNFIVFGQGKRISGYGNKIFQCKIHNLLRN